MQSFYSKYKKIIEQILYPFVLLILPVMNFNMGVDVSDSTYSLGNYLFADRLSGMWVISTYLSNKIGAIMLRLPGATNLKWANMYTGLLLGCIGLIVYFVLKKDLDAKYIFIGEFIAISFCWIPTGILYNYLSYMIMVIGALLLYKGIMKDDRRYYASAGLVLGINVFVRIPNITQMALVVALWFICFVTGRKWFKDTLVCVAGYIVGVAIPGVIILAGYGIDGITDMIAGLGGITSTDETYTPLSMITGPIKAYIFSMKWAAVILAVVFGGVVMFRIMPDKLKTVKTVIYLGVTALMLRFFWGRGMFSFRYYEDYTSMYEWGVIALYLSIGADVFVMADALRNRGKDVSVKPEWVLAAMSFMIIVIAPLGSNNNLYQNLNNLFMVMPLTVYIIYRWIRMATERKNCMSIPAVGMLYVLLICIIIQGFGFSLNFVFRDGTRGEKRDTKITTIESLKGMYTNAENAKTLEGLNEYVQTLDAQELILFGDCPGLTYVLNKPSALFSSWIDLDSNPVNQVEEELDALKTDSRNIPVIVRKAEGSAVAYEKKKQLVDSFISEGGYEMSYENEQFLVYTR